MLFGSVGFVEKRHTVLFYLQVSLDITVSGGGLRMAEPQGNDLNRDACVEEPHRGRMPNRMRSDFLSIERGTGFYRFVEREF